MIRRLKHDREYRAHIITILTAAINLAYALGNSALGLSTGSFWFLTVGAYFLVLSVMKLGCLNALRSRRENARYIGKFVGLLLILLCVVLIGSIVLSDRLDVIRPVHRITMFAIAAFTMSKTGFALINIVRAKRKGDPVWFALRNITCADAAASILSMQRSMLVSFGRMAADIIRILNLFTGMAVSVVILFLGVSLILRAKPPSP